MTGSTTRRAAPALPRATAGVLALLFLWLPALVGGIGIDDPARPGELARVDQGLQRTAGELPRSLPAQLYYAAAMPSEPRTTEPQRLLSRARLSSVLGLFVIASLLYLVLLLTLRRSTGALACLALTALPPIYADGAALRPEVPAAVFAGLAMVLIAGFPSLARRRRGSTARRWISMVACAAVTGIALGLAMACVTRTSVLLLVPGGALLLGVGGVLLSLPRVVQRRGLDALPLRAIPSRLGPWVLLGMTNLVAAVLILDWFVEGNAGSLRATSSTVGLLPPAPWSYPLLALATLGGIALLLKVGVGLSRRRRVTPDSMLLVYVAVLLAQRALGSGGTDALVAAPAMAVLIAEGGMVGLALVLHAIRRKVAGRPTSSL